jgi:DNA-binding transcriptional ArsR family regulator
VPAVPEDSQRPYSFSISPGFWKFNETTPRLSRRDEVRLEILRLLSDNRPRVCNEVQDALGLLASTCSYHLRLLREAGLTRARSHGTERAVTLRRNDVELARRRHNRKPEAKRRFAGDLGGGGAEGIRTLEGTEKAPNGF